MNKKLKRSFLALMFAITFGVAASRADAACGNGVLEGGEECDPGGGLYIDGNPGLATCMTGGDCFYEFSCCKFNCQFVGQGAPCFDGDACTTNDICDNVGQCASGGNAGNGTPCEDGLYCTTGDTCTNGTCNSGPGNPCTGVECVSACDEGTDSCEIDVGGPCATDGNSCTDDVCDAGGVCTHPNNAAPCDDSIFCNGADACSGGTCSSHAGDPCAGGNACANQCDEGLDTCNLPDMTACDDGLFCTDVDSCIAGACVGSGDPCLGGLECSAVCNELADDCFDLIGSPCAADADVCTDDVCDGSGTCSHPVNSAPCDDGLECTSNDTCVNGVCIGDPPPECDDLNPCTVDGCEEPSGDCVNLATPAPSCSEAGLAQLVIVNRDDVPGRDRLKWKWGRPTDALPVLLEDVGNPVTTTQYDLCLFDTTVANPDGVLVEHISIPPSSLWVPRPTAEDPGKFLYKDNTTAAGGVRIVKVKLGERPSFGLRAEGDNLDLVAQLPGERFMEMDSFVAAQFVNSEGKCWVSIFDEAKRNTDRKFRTRVVGIVIK